MGEKATGDESEILKHVIESLRDLSEDSRNRVLKTVLTYFDYRLPAPTSNGANRTLSTQPDREPSFGDRPSLSPRDFMHEKDPKTDVERVTCLAYYLTNYRDIPHFKTVDISKLNTEAAQIKLSNPSASIENATKAGLLTSASGGNKQISMHGDRVVLALPDRDKVREILKSIKRRAKRKGKGESQYNHESDPSEANDAE